MAPALVLQVPLQSNSHIEEEPGTALLLALGPAPTSHDLLGRSNSRLYSSDDFLCLQLVLQVSEDVQTLQCH